ncbi:MAG: LytTR family DNA-binding domain-containing protein [Bacteroidota bacterium]
MKCIIVEDEEPAIKVLKNHIGHFSDLEICGVYHTTMDALLALQKTKIDILFLDIQLPKISGIQFLRSLSQKPSVILTTAHRKYALDGYELEIVDYLLKPISLERFTKAIAKVYALTKRTLEYPRIENGTNTVFSAPFIYVKSEGEYVKVNLEELVYVESIKNHIKLITTKETIITLMGISQMEEILPTQYFVRIHRSYLVALNHISKFTANYLIIKNKHLPIGKHFKQKFFEKINERKI